MRFSLVVALVMASLTVTAVAEKHQKPKAKPSYSEEKAAKGSAHSVKPSTGRNSAAQELHRVEQSSARMSASRKGDGSKAARPGAVARVEKQERNPPIQAGSSHGSGQSGKSKGGNSYKGRLRHKGSHH